MLESAVLNRPDWLEVHRRLGYISASEVAAIMGLSPYESPFSLFHKKRDGLAWNESDTKTRFRVGHALEPVVAEEFALAYPDMIVTDPNRHEDRCPGGSVGELSRVYWQEDKPWLVTTLDRTVNGPLRPEPGVYPARPLEIKTTEPFTPDAKEWREGNPPLAVQAQLQAQIAILGVDHGYLGGLIGFSECVFAKVERHVDFIKVMREYVKEFHLALIGEGPEPEVDGHRATTAALARMFPRDFGEVVHLPEVAAKQYGRYIAAKAVADDASERLDAEKNWWRKVLGEATAGNIPGVGTVKYSTVERSGNVRVAWKEEDGARASRAQELLEKAGYTVKTTPPSASRRLTFPKQKKG